MTSRSVPAGDLVRATNIARALVEDYGAGGTSVGIGYYPTLSEPNQPKQQLSPQQLEAIDTQVGEILEKQRQRAIEILTENAVLVETLRDLLIQHKVIDSKTLGQLTMKLATEMPMTGS